MGILDCFFKKSEMTIAAERLRKSQEWWSRAVEIVRKETIGEEAVRAEEAAKEAERERQRLLDWDDW